VSGQQAAGRGDVAAIAGLRRDYGSQWRIWYQDGEYRARRGDTELRAATARELGGEIDEAAGAWQR
jgi:hypothetical protein